MVSKRLFLNICLYGILFSFLTVIAPVTQVVHAGQLIQMAGSPLPGNDTVDLGMAYHSFEKGFYGLYSVDGSEDTSFGNTEINIRVGVDLGYSEVHNLLSGNLDLHFEHPVISVDAGASLANETAADSYTGTYTFFSSFTPKKRLWVPHDNTGYQSTAAADALVNAFPNDILERVGDEFVACIEYGSLLMINMSIEYRNAEDKQKIGGYLSCNWKEKIQVDGDLSMVDETTKQSVKITIRGKQEGGDPIQLFNIIPEGIMSCTLSNPDSCFDIFENAVAYAKGDYLAQLNELSDYNVVRLFTERYEDSGPEMMNLIPSGGYPMLTYISKIALKNINQNWEKAMLDKRRATNILQYYSGYLTTSQKQEVEAIKQKANRNAYKYALAAEGCLEDPYDDACRALELNTETTIETYDPDALKISGN